MKYLNQFLPSEHAILYKAWDMARYNKRLDHVRGVRILMYMLVFMYPFFFCISINSKLFLWIMAH